jgi:polar amino acid transport system substrate-binding protein
MMRLIRYGVRQMNSASTTRMNRADRSRNGKQQGEAINRKRRRSLAPLAALIIACSALTLFPVFTPTAPAQTEPTPASEEVNTLRVSTKAIEPFVFVDDQGGVRGLSIDVWTEIEKTLGVKTQWQVRSNVKEVLDDVTKGKADLAIAGISMTPQREATFDFSHSYFDSGLQILTRGKSSRSAPGIFFDTVTSRRVVQPMLWLLVSAVVVAHVMWLLQRRHNPAFPKGYLPGLWESFWWASVNVMSGGDGGKEVSRGLGRIVSFVWMILGVLLIAYVTGQFSAALTVGDLKSDITTVGDLFGKKVETTGGSVSAQYLDEVGLAHSNVDVIDDRSYQRLLDGKIDAIVYDSPSLRYAAKKYSGRLTLAGPIFQPDKYGIAMPTDSKLREQINAALLEMQADGTMAALSTKWFGT